MKVRFISTALSGLRMTGTDEEGYEIPRGVDVNVIASTLLKYLNDLPEPLLTYDLFDRILEVDSVSSSC